MLKRTPEKEIMDDPSQSRCYDEGVKFTSAQGAYLFLGDILNLCAPAEGEAIDLGCGQASLDIDLASRVPGLTIDCLDLSEPMLEIAKKNIKESENYNNNLSEQIHFFKHDVFNLESFSGTYAMAVCMFMLHHIKDKKEAIGFLRGLKKILTDKTAIVFADFLLQRSILEKNISSFIFTRGFSPIFKKDFINSLAAAFSLEDYREMFLEAGFKDIEFYTSPFLKTFVFMLRPYKGKRAKFVDVRNSPFWEGAGTMAKVRYRLSWVMAKLAGFKIKENYTNTPEL